MTTRGSYVHNSYGKNFRGIPKILVLCNFLKILIVSDKMIHRAFRTRATLREIFHFHYLPKLYIGFNHYMTYNEQASRHVSGKE